jgi:hypothetical protein
MPDAAFTLQFEEHAWESFIHALKPFVENDFVATIGTDLVWLEGWVPEDPFRATSTEPLVRVQPLNRDHTLAGPPVELTLLELIDHPVRIT